MDLFYSNMTPEEQLQKLTKDILVSIKTRKKKLSIINGDISDIGNNVLFLLPNVTSLGFMKDDDATELVRLISEYKIDKYMITYSYLLPTEQMSRIQIREFSVWIERLLEIIQPRLIVLVGEESTLTFCTRKVKIENHGKIVTKYQDIPCILTFSPYYYAEHSAYEDEAYKNFLKEKDWKFIKSQYDKYIKE